MFTKNQTRQNGQTVLPKTAPCDICGKNIHSRQGYLLPTHQVLAQRAYWQFYFEQVLDKQISLKKLDRKMVMTAFFHFACGDSPYLVCEKCAGMFTFERSRAKKAAAIWWQTGKPDSGDALCKYHAAGFGGIRQFEPLDEPHLSQAFSAAMLALRPSNPELVEAILVYHRMRAWGIV
jgi:hypothetical protein